ncbi:MAG: type II toxin-antitoxin system Phd/YefM family antitoxin [Caulobacteraceae bacterium]
MSHPAPIPSNEAKTHLAQLLDRVERGEELTITRHGRAIARLIPAGADHDVVAAKRAVASLFEYREALASLGTVAFGVDDILDLRDAGRKY